jgi:DNA-binding response OmpR family regulator
VTRLALELDSLHRIVRRNGAAVELGPTGFRIVALLVKCPGGLEREALRNRIFAGRDDGGPSDDSLSVTISMLRKTIAPLGLRISQARWGLPYQIEDAS